MKIATSRRLLAATLGLFALVPFARADALSDAHAALAASDFAAMKSALDPLLIANPAPNASLDDARLLRALARLGLAAENDLPVFLRNKLGAKTAFLDLASDTYGLTFPYRFVYGTSDAFTVSGGTYSRTTALDDTTPGRASVISFQNKGDAPYALTLHFTRGAEGLADGQLNFELNAEMIGFLSAQPDDPTPFYRYYFVPFSPDLTASEANQTVTIVIPAGSALTVALVYAQANFRLTPVGPLPSTLTVLNGKGVVSATESFAATANVADFFKFAGDLDTATLTPLVDDLEAATPSLALVLTNAETGHSQDIVIGYPDAQLLLAEFKFLQALRRLSTSYKLTQALTPSFFDADLGQIIAKNPTFLSPLTPSVARSADRLLARTLLEEVVDHYQAASDAGLWDRPAPSAGTYLFSLGEEGSEGAADLKETADNAFAQFRAALSAPITVPLSDELEADISLAPLFGSPALNVRKILPLSTDNGIIRGSSTPLLTSGLIQNLGTAGWEHFLEHSGNADLITPALQTAPKIQRQPAALTSVEEGESATLSVLAECYPAPDYQWYRGSGASAVPIPEATEPTLFFEAADRDDAGVYTVRITNTRQLSPAAAPLVTTIISKPARLYVTYAPEIKTSTADLSRYTGKTVTLDVVAVGVPAPRYQWFKGDVAVTPVRAASKYVFAASAARAGDYHVVVTNIEGTATGDPVTVDVQTKPVFTLQPLAQTVSVNGSVTFTAAATGNPMPTLKWRKDGKDIPGATGPSYTIAPVALIHRGVYTAVASSTVNTSPTTTAVVSTVSLGARLTVPATP